MSATFASTLAAQAVQAVQEHKGLALAALVLTVVVAYLLWDAGVLQPVKLETKVLGPFLIIYQDVVVSAAPVRKASVGRLLGGTPFPRLFPPVPVLYPRCAR